MPQKEIRIFPYTYRIPQSEDNVANLRMKFNRTRITQNVKPYGDDFLLIIIDDYEGNLLFGRFLILRSDVPGILNRRTRSEREIQLLRGENIKEESRFVWGVADKVILGEYNHHAIRHFAHPMMFYLNEIFNVEDSDVRPIRNPETFSLMRSEREIKKFEVSVAQESLSTIEKEHGISLIGALIGLSNMDESIITITISKGYKKDNKLDKPRMLELARTLKSREDDLYSLRIIGENSKYDLLNDNLIVFKSKVNTRNKRVVTQDFYNKVKVTYRNNIAIIRERLAR